jgi:Hemerythrin HHE cation binding domain
MSEHKTMNTIIHAAIRRDLSRFETAFELFPAGSKRRADELAIAWDNLAFQLHHHHEDEETIFWPVLRALGADDTLTSCLKGEHAQMIAALAAANDEIDSFRVDPTGQRAASARRAVGSLDAVLTAHLSHEERDLEPESIRHHATRQIKDAQRRVRKAHRGNQGTLFTWLQDGADADEIAALRREVPRPVLFLLCRTSGRRYRRTIAPVWA